MGFELTSEAWGTEDRFVRLERAEAVPIKREDYPATLAPRANDACKRA
jgi:hypothetical protein